MVHDKNIYKLNSIMRYNTQIRVCNETVASHSYFVAYFANQLCTKHSLCDSIRLKALRAAIVHDAPEAILNDITHDVKQLIPGLSDMLQPYEESIIKSLDEPSCEVLFSPTDLEDIVAQAVVKYADVLSVEQYCKNEVEMGNEHFKDMLYDSYIRANIAKIELGTWIGEYESKNKKEAKTCQRTTI